MGDYDEFEIVNEFGEDVPDVRDAPKQQRQHGERDRPPRKPRKPHRRRRRRRRRIQQQENILIQFIALFTWNRFRWGCIIALIIVTLLIVKWVYDAYFKNKRRG